MHNLSLVHVPMVSRERGEIFMLKKCSDCELVVTA
jgi:hypothetical protein